MKQTTSEFLTREILLTTGALDALRYVEHALRGVVMHLEIEALRDSILLQIRCLENKKEKFEKIFDLEKED